MKSLRQLLACSFPFYPLVLVSSFRKENIINKCSVSSGVKCELSNCDARVEQNGSIAARTITKDIYILLHF